MWLLLSENLFSSMTLSSDVIADNKRVDTYNDYIIPSNYCYRKLHRGKC